MFILYNDKIYIKQLYKIEYIYIYIINNIILIKPYKNGSPRLMDEKRTYPCPCCGVPTDRVNGHGYMCNVSVGTNVFGFMHCNHIAYNCDKHNLGKPYDRRTCIEHAHASYGSCTCGQNETDCECDDAGWNLNENNTKDDDDVKDDDDAAGPNPVFNAFGVVPCLIDDTIDDTIDDDADDEADGVVGS